MALVTLAEAKKQCRVTHDLEDDLITLYMNAADDWIRNYLNQEQIPPQYAVKAAALLIIEDLFKNRAATSEVQLYANPAVDRLLFPYRVEMGI